MSTLDMFPKEWWNSWVIARTLQGTQQRCVGENVFRRNLNFEPFKLERWQVTEWSTKFTRLGILIDNVVKIVARLDGKREFTACMANHSFCFHLSQLLPGIDAWLEAIWEPLKGLVRGERERWKTWQWFKKADTCWWILECFEDFVDSCGDVEFGRLL